jgi:hypothetical protein
MDAHHRRDVEQNLDVVAHLLLVFPTLVDVDPTLVDAHLDEVDGVQVDVELLRLLKMKMDCCLHVEGVALQ